MIANGEAPDANLVLMPGDVVSVPKAGMFYVEGIVSKPGAYPLLEKTTVSEAVATAGGADTTLANIGGTVLYRKKDDGSREADPGRPRIAAYGRHRRLRGARERRDRRPGVGSQAVLRS
jgi:protein involved in polysaccharide export with SLBB domain